MGARFILSFDCEGKWGVADHLRQSDHASLCDGNLKKSYRAILALLDEFEISATFAFVGCFSLSRPALASARPELEALAERCPRYLAPAIQDIWHGSATAGGDWAYEAVMDAKTRHEIALHGATHIPWDSPGMDIDLARQELGLLARVGAPITRETKTYVFPRNAVAYPSVLSDSGFVGYRTARHFSNRALSLLSELDLLARPDGEAVRDTGPVQIPAGYFINWRHGPRRLVPVGLSALRARLILERADACNGIVHYWTHPENIASAPDTLHVLREILACVAERRNSGPLQVMTQEDYCTTVDCD